MSLFSPIQMLVQHNAFDFNGPLLKFHISYLVSRLKCLLLQSLFLIKTCSPVLLNCPKPKTAGWDAKVKTPRSQMIVSIAVFSTQLYFYCPSTLYIGITVVRAYLCGGIGPLHYLTDSGLSSATGSNIGTLLATDMDEEGTLNSRLQFKIGSQVPAIPASNLFFIQQETGILQLTSRSLNRRIASNYSLKVLVTDAGMYCLLLYIRIILSTLASPVLSVQGMRGDLEDSLDRQQHWELACSGMVLPCSRDAGRLIMIHNASMEGNQL